MNKRVYIAGPMRGHKTFNFPAFDEAADWLKACGWEPISPADHDRESGFDPSNMTGNEDLAAEGFDLKAALAWDLEQVSQSAAVAVLDGWQKSRGAMAEVTTAWALGIPVVPWKKFFRDAADYPCFRPEHAITDRPNAVNGAHVVAKGEIRTTSSTGGEKGTKPERFDLIPVGALATVARLYGRGAEKYAAHNWRRGYEWSKSYAAMQRHATQFWDGEDIDQEMQLPHLASVVFHALALLTFMDEHRAFDDRFKPGTPEPSAGPSEGAPRDAQPGLHVGARVKVLHTSNFMPGWQGIITEQVFHERYDWMAHLDGCQKPSAFHSNELEAIG